MLIRAVIVGIDHFADLTEPFVRSLLNHNPGIGVTVVDNASRDFFPTLPMTETIRLGRLVGYGEALNNGVELSDNHEWDWLLCANNDCLCNGPIQDKIASLRTDTVYGNAWKYDYEWMSQLHLPAVVDSAFLLIPRKIWDAVGQFDPEMDAAFEEIDYGLRVLDAGFRLDVADLPIVHLDRHTRRELPNYDARWAETSRYFSVKYKNRLSTWEK